MSIQPVLRNSHQWSFCNFLNSPTGINSLPVLAFNIVITYNLNISYFHLSLLFLVSLSCLLWGLKTNSPKYKPTGMGRSGNLIAEELQCMPAVPKGPCCNLNISSLLLVHVYMCIYTKLLWYCFCKALHKIPENKEK